MDYMQLAPAWFHSFYINHSSNLEGDQNEHYR